MIDGDRSRPRESAPHGRLGDRDSRRAGGGVRNLDRPQRHRNRQRRSARIAEVAARFSPLAAAAKYTVVDAVTLVRPMGRLQNLLAGKPRRRTSRSRATQPVISSSAETSPIARPKKWCLRTSRHSVAILLARRQGDRPAPNRIGQPDRREGLHSRNRRHRAQESRHRSASRNLSAHRGRRGADVLARSRDLSHR